MAISKSRLFFRHFLITLLIFALSFFSIAAYFYVTTRNNPEKLANVSPVLHSIDIVQYQIRAYISDMDERHAIAQEMLRKSRYAKIYTGAAADLLFPLAQKGHEPSVALYRDIIRSTPIMR
ncbi:MAG: hypothetical protein ACRBCK_09740 [Alphaproteobacteria bacterium]